MLTGCTFPFLDLSIFFPTLSFNFSIISVFDEGRSRWRLGYSGAFWSQGMLGVRAFGAALRAVKGNRFNHAVKQVFTGLHYNVIFSPPLSLSILLPSECLDFLRLMIFDQRERVVVGGVQLDDSVCIARLGTLYPAEKVSNTEEMWRPIKTHLQFYQTREINEKG